MMFTVYVASPERVKPITLLPAARLGLATTRLLIRTGPFTAPCAAVIVYRRPAALSPVLNWIELRVRISTVWPFDLSLGVSRTLRGIARRCSQLNVTFAFGWSEPTITSQVLLPALDRISWANTPERPAQSSCMTETVTFGDIVGGFWTL